MAHNYFIHFNFQKRNSIAYTFFHLRQETIKTPTPATSPMTAEMRTRMSLALVAVLVKRFQSGHFGRHLAVLSSQKKFSRQERVQFPEPDSKRLFMFKTSSRESKFLILIVT